MLHSIRNALLDQWQAIAKTLATNAAITQHLQSLCELIVQGAMVTTQM
jgi:hypothetical protein